jgi:hypothetical protein
MYARISKKGGAVYSRGKAYMKTYIVRVYRLEKGKPLRLAGVVEEVGIKGRKGFTNYDELWDILRFSTSSRYSRNKEKNFTRDERG